MNILFWGIRSGVFFRLGRSMRFLRNWNYRANSLIRAPSSGGGSNASRPAVSVPHRAGIGYVGWARQARRAQSFVFWAVYARAILGSWHIYAALSIERKNHMGKHLFPSWHHFQIGFLFRPHHTSCMVTPRSAWPIVHIVVRLTAVSLLFDIGFQGLIPSLFERSLSSRGAVPYRTTSLHPVSVLTLHPREIQLISMWSQTVRQSKPNNRN